MPQKFVCVIGPGASEECERIAQQYRLVHLAMEGDEETASKIEYYASAISKSGSNNFVIKDFPASLEDYFKFEHKTGLAPEFVLYLEGPDQQDVLERSFLQHLEIRGLLKKINPASYTAELQTILFTPILQNELLGLSEDLLRAIDGGDYAAYQRLCDDGLTAFEPESQGQLLEGLPFHKFYFDMRQSGGFLQRVSTIAAFRATLVSDGVALVTYTRLMQAVGTPLAGYTDAYNETRVWKLRRPRSPEDGHSQWKNVHFHRSKAPTNPEFYNVTR